MTATKITPRLYVSGIEEAYVWHESHPKGVILCVWEQHEKGIEVPEETHIHLFNHKIMPGDLMYVPQEKMDKITSLITSQLKNEKEVLVHCGEGIERSPLVIACYLARENKLSIEEAYKIVEAKRPQTQLRLSYLEKPKPWQLLNIVSGKSHTIHGWECVKKAFGVIR
jgi:predicted protein tyrosine phosphatase